MTSLPSKFDPSRKHLLPSVSKPDVPVFNLEVLLLNVADKHMYRTRIANLQIASVEKATPRDAIAAIVGEAKKLVAECVASGTAIPWREPKDEPSAGETRMFVPMHL